MGRTRQQLLLQRGLLLLTPPLRWQKKTTRLTAMMMTTMVLVGLLVDRTAAAALGLDCLVVAGHRYSTEAGVAIGTTA